MIFNKKEWDIIRNIQYSALNNQFSMNGFILAFSVERSVEYLESR